MDIGLISYMQSAPPFGMDMSTDIQGGAQLLNVAVLAVVLAFLLYKPVRSVLHKRTDKIQRQLQQADDEMTRAVELRQQYEQKMEEVDKEKEEILGQARKDASETGKRLLSEAKVEADAVRERAAQHVAMEWERAEAEMRTAIIDVSAVMAEKFVSLSISKETHDKLLADAASDLEGMTWRD